MNNFVRDAICTVYTSTVNELVVLTHGKHLRSSIIQKRETDKKVQDIERHKLPAATLNEIKLKNDLKKLIETYMDILAEFQSQGTIHTLLEEINQQTEKNNEEQKLIEDHKSSISVLRSLTARLTEFKSEAESKVLQISETLNNLKSDRRIINKINDLEYELVKKWEHTRFTQATILGERDENVLQTNLSTLVAKHEAEQRVITDFQAYSKRQLGKYTELIEMWKDKYAKEMNDLLVSIAEKKNKIQEVNKTYEKYLEINCKREKFIADYLEQKAEQNRLLELHKKRIESAIKIQAWWRGLMVRRCLGPYKKKSKKGKKGGKKAK